MIKTDICDLLQIEYPIFQGGMAWLGTAELAAAVSEAGGLGIIGAGHMPPDIFRNEIHKLKERTSKPFGCNIMLMSPFVKEGDSVTEGQTLCIVEAMKLMNAPTCDMPMLWWVDPRLASIVVIPPSDNVVP